MKNAFIKNTNGGTFLHFFNTKEVYSLDRFDTERKARNYAKKYGYHLFDKLPDNVKPFDLHN